MTKKNVKVNYNGEPLKADEVLVFTHQSEPPNTFFPDIFLTPLLVFYFIILVHFFSIHPVANDGGFGDGTLKATKEVQKASGIEVDGIVGKDTINAVYALETKAYNAQTNKITNAKKALA